ncbi:MAG TPA: CvpA family protein [Bacillales bacterium]|nr:CvpA family protein [Bacillales bacterium]
MLTLIIAIILLIGFIIGLRRGLIFEVVHLTGFIVAFAVAYMYFDDIAPRLRLWIPYPVSTDHVNLTFLSNALSLQDAYYNAMAFAILFFGTKILLHIIGSMLDFLADLPLLKTANRWLGGAFGFIEVYLIVFLLLYMVALVPIAFIQQSVSHSVLAQAIVHDTPVFSQQIKHLWFPGGGA